MDSLTREHLEAAALLLVVVLPFWPKKRTLGLLGFLILTFTWVASLWVLLT